MDSTIKRTTYDDAKYILANRSKLLLGRSRKERPTRIMVTLDIDTAHQPQLIEDFSKMEWILQGLTVHITQQLNGK